MKRVLCLAFAALFLAAAAPDPADRLPDAGQEARARAIFSGVRCVVCQNESIDDSEADLAHDLRQTIRAEVAAGRSDEEIRRFLVARYGDFILLKPGVNATTALLWGAPFAILLIGGAVLVLQRRRSTEDEPLSEDELKRLKNMDKAAQDGDLD